jgi:hypothetical protein
MISNVGNVAVDLGKCFKNGCDKNCLKKDCELCVPCVGYKDLSNLHEAHREHSRRGGFKRVFPTKPHFDEKFISRLTKDNIISVKWFEAKCREDFEWC